MAKRKRKVSKNQQIITVVVVVILILALCVVAYVKRDVINDYIAKNFQKKETAREYANLPQDLSALYQSPTGELLEVYFFDVGQGDCILGKFPNGETFMIDAGSSKKNLDKTVDYTEDEAGEGLISYINSKSISKIDYMFLTHVHQDHISFLDDIINEYEVKKIFMPNVRYEKDGEVIDLTGGKFKATASTVVFKEFLIATQNEISQGCILEILDYEGDYKQITIGGSVTLDIYTPSDELYATSSPNDQSPIIFMSYAERSICFTGDAEVDGEAYFMSIAKGLNKTYDVDILKVGHHGSTTSSSQEFLDFIDMEIAIIMAGFANKHKHPTPEVCKRFAKYQDVVKDDDADGLQFIFNTWEGYGYKEGDEKFDCGNIEVIIGSNGGLGINLEKETGRSILPKYRQLAGIA